MSHISAQSASHKNRTNRFRRMFLGLEQLEDRRCFNVDFGLSDNGHTLKISGDRANDSIAVVQDASGVHVTANSERTINFTNIERLVLSAGGGDDAVPRLTYSRLIIPASISSRLNRFASAPSLLA